MAQPSISIQIDASKFLKWIDESPEKFKRALESVIHKGAALIERESKIKSPVDTGRMRASIATDFIPMQATIQPHVDYAVFVHEGTRYMSPRPFMYEGAELASRSFDAIVKQELDRI